MESTNYHSEYLENFGFEVPKDFSRINRFLENNDTSNVKLEFGTDNAGIIYISKKVDISEKYHPYSQLGIITSSLKSAVEVDLNEFNISDSIKFNKVVSDFPPIEIIPLVFSSEVENLIIRDMTFRRFINEIERGLNYFIEFENMKLESSIFFEEDWEYPNYKKLILSLDFKGVSFEQELYLWKEVNNIIYNRIKSYILHLSEQQGNKIKKLKKNLFINLKM